MSNSVIGEGCIIGSNVSIDGCYIWDKVTIEDGCRLKHAIVCDGVIMMSGAVLEAGVVLSFKVFLFEFPNQMLPICLGAILSYFATLYVNCNIFVLSLAWKSFSGNLVVRHY